MNLFLFFLFLSLLSCGIKSKPKPLPEPKFQIKRIGEFVYVIGNNLEVPGFKKVDGFWFTQKEEAFCFDVKRIKGKSKRVCVPKAVKQYPQISVKELKGAVKLISKEEGIFRIYKIKNTFPVPFPIKEFNKETFIPKTYSKYRIAVTKTLKENVESAPIFIDIPPKPKPIPDPPYDVGYFILDGKVVIYWFHKKFEDLQGFNIYKNGKKINKKPLKVNTFVDTYPQQTTIYEIRAVNKFGLESKGVSIKIKPHATK